MNTANAAAKLVRNTVANGLGSAIGLKRALVADAVDIDRNLGERVRRLLDGPDTALRMGDAVTVAFEDVAPGVSVPAFRVAGSR